MADPGLVIRNARILDGSGASAVPGDVEIRDGRISSVGSATTGQHEIDAAGHVLSPGFVDTHTHDDAALLRYPGMEFKLAQGCTSLVIGNCGFSAAPNRPEGKEPPGSGGLFRGVKAEWEDLAGYFDAVEARKPALNAVALVGHNTIRALVMGDEDRAPSDSELAEMRGHTALAMEQGACGFSTGLIYRPGRYSKTEEIVAVAGPVAEHGGLYATHMRNEGDGLLDAVEETLRIGREVGCAVQISHHKSAGRENWGKVGESLARVDKANAEGADVTLDVYPYTAGSGPMIEYFRLDAISRSLAEVVRIANCPAFREYEGRMVTEIGSELGLPATEVVRKVLTAPGGERTICIQFIIDEADIETNLRHPKMMVGSDGIPDLTGSPHPRLFGTFPRVLGHYVRERGVLSLEEAVRRMTSLSCERFGLLERGLIREGYWADLVIFDPDRVVDTATYDDPKQEPEGIRAVIVNGQVAYEDGRHTGVGAGRMLRYRSATS